MPFNVPALLPTALFCVILFGLTRSIHPIDDAMMKIKLRTSKFYGFFFRQNILTQKFGYFKKYLDHCVVNMTQQFKSNTMTITNATGNNAATTPEFTLTKIVLESGKFQYQVIETKTGKVFSDVRSNREYVAATINGRFHFERVDLIGKGDHGHCLAHYAFAKIDATNLSTIAYLSEPVTTPAKLETEQLSTEYPAKPAIDRLMFESSDKFNENIERFGNNSNTCFRCGRPCSPKGLSFHVHYTTWGFIVNTDDEKQIPKDKFGDSQGFFPIGSACAKFVPKEYRFKIETAK